MRILIASAVDDAARLELEQRHDVVTKLGACSEELGDLIRDRQVLIFRSGVEVNADVLRGAPDLEFIIRAGSGLDNIDLAVAQECGVRVVRIPGPSARAVAEFTFGLLLAVCRNIAFADRRVRQGAWPKSELSGSLLKGQTLGVLGAGNIGSMVCQLGAAWEMNVLAYVTELPERLRPLLYRPGIELVDKPTLLRESDFLSINVPLNDSTRNLVDASFLARMKETAVLINTARGGVVDEDALYDALSSGHLAGAGLDVHRREGEGVLPRLAELPNVVLTPHIGAMADQSQYRIGQRLLELLAAHEAGRLDLESDKTEMVL